MQPQYRDAFHYLDAAIEQVVIGVVEQDGGQAASCVYGLESAKVRLYASKMVGALAKKLDLGRK